jgi:glyoxylase-like metal-dependent hydrolase (beta-lactamase superfamily II)
MIPTTILVAGALSRRQFVHLASASGLGLFAGATRLQSASRQSQSSRVAAGPWGHIERLGEGIWAVVSTPLAHDDWTTLCNGGIVAGSDRVLVIESFAAPAGARLVAQQARELSGRWPTDVLVTHYHGDHANGLEGFAAGDSRPVIWMTATTRKLIVEADRHRDESLDPLRKEMLDSARLIDPEAVLQLNLGDIGLQIHPRRGHTSSDVTVELEQPSIVFCGDLIWNQMFPNFRDTLPSALSKSLRSLRREAATTYVPGHGPLATDAAVGRFADLIDSVEAAARKAIENGTPAVEAAAEYRIPEALEDWHLFRESYFEVAIGAWFKELGIDPAS